MVQFNNTTRGESAEKTPSLENTFVNVHETRYET